MGSFLFRLSLLTGHEPPTTHPCPWTVRIAARLWSAVAGGEQGWHRFGWPAEGRSESGVCPHPSPTALHNAGARAGAGA